MLKIYKIISLSNLGGKQMSCRYDVALSFCTENEEIVERVYHYLRAEGLLVFYAPAPECQVVLSGKNQREIFYEIFGLGAEFVALFVSCNYVKKRVPMEEASIAIAKHSENGSVIPVYIDGTELPIELLDNKKTNYFSSDNAAEISNHLAQKIKENRRKRDAQDSVSDGKSIVNITDNKAEKQVFIQNVEGSLNF